MTTYKKLSKEHVSYLLASIEKALLDAPTLEEQLELQNRLVKEVMKVSSSALPKPVELPSRRKHPRTFAPCRPVASEVPPARPSPRLMEQWNVSSPSQWTGFPTPAQCGAGVCPAPKFSFSPDRRRGPLYTE